MKLSYLAYRLKYIYGQNFKLTTPVDVSLELSSACNQACVYCFHADKENLPFKQKIMSLDMAMKVIDQAAELGVNSLKFNYRGESTLHPKFAMITGYAKSLAKGSNSIFIDRLTNSNFKFDINRDDIFHGLCNQTKVKVSFDSFRKDIFEKQRAGGIYEKALANVDKFYNFERRRETELVIQAVRTKLNADEDLEGFVRKRWPSATASIRDVVAGRLERDIGNLETRTRDKSSRQSCLQAHVRLIVLHDGRVTPCCPSIKEDLVIGDVKAQTLREIFNSEMAHQLRKDLKSGKAFDKDPCKTCSSFESYKGYVAPWKS